MHFLHISQKDWNNGLFIAISIALLWSSITVFFLCYYFANVTGFLQLQPIKYFVKHSELFMYSISSFILISSLRELKLNYKESHQKYLYVLVNRKGSPAHNEYEFKVCKNAHIFSTSLHMLYLATCILK